MLLMVVEFGVSELLFGRTVFEHWQHFGTFPANFRILGQMAFSVFPAEGRADPSPG